jgi:hypothetical protein
VDSDIPDENGYDTVNNQRGVVHRFLGHLTETAGSLSRGERAEGRTGLGPVGALADGPALAEGCLPPGSRLG